MDSIILISPDDLTKGTPLGGNIDIDKYEYIIRETQVFVIEKILGTKLYKKIESDYKENSLDGVYDKIHSRYLKPIIIYTVAAEFITMGGIMVANAGIFRYRPEDTESVSMRESDRLATDQRNKADVYIERLQRYLSDSVNDIPEYELAQDNNYDTRPDRDLNTYGGWMMGYNHRSSNAEIEIWKDIIHDEGR